MIKYPIAILFFLSSFLMKSQNWDSIRGGKFQNELHAAFYDSIHDQLIVSSHFINKVGSLPVRGVCSWNGSHWDSLAGGINTHDLALNPNAPGGDVFCGVPYNGKLLVGGSFYSIGGVNATSLATWDGNHWDSLPVRAFKFLGTPGIISGMYRHGNLIYLYGYFDTIAGQPAQGLATWDGTSFHAIPLPISTQGHIYSMAVYKSEMYICGNFSNGTSPVHFVDMLKFNGSNWVELANGIQGGISGVYDMAIYNDTLYAGGWIFKSDGNVGDLVMKWDGNQWHDAGFDGAQYGSVSKFLVYHNKLWALGGYDKGAYMPAYGTACYDGSKWCVLKDSLVGITTAAILHDTIYIAGGFQNVNRDSSIAYIAKLKDPNLFSGCNATGVNEISLSGHINIYPNPAASVLTIDDEQNELQGSTIEVVNYLGQSILSVPYVHSIDVSALSSGCYILRISSPYGQSYYAKFIKD